MNVNEVLLLGLSEPEYSRNEFWLKYQKESGFSPGVFWRKLNDSWQVYSNLIEQKISGFNALGNQVTDWRIPLVHETGGKLQGHVGRPELETLRQSLIKYGVDQKIIIYKYAYDHSNIQFAQNGPSSAARLFDMISNINTLRFESELKQKKADEIPSFLDFHLRQFLRNGGDIQTWISSTGKLTTDLSLEQKDAFLSWFEKRENPNVNIETAASPDEEDTGATKKTIAEELESVDNIKGWEYLFYDKKDYDEFLNLLTKFFQDEKFVLPKQKIRLRKGSKTRLAQSMNGLHDKLKMNEQPLKSDTKFFALLRVLSSFSNDSDIEIYKAITR